MGEREFNTFEIELGVSLSSFSLISLSCVCVGGGHTCVSMCVPGPLTEPEFVS